MREDREMTSETSREISRGVRVWAFVVCAACVLMQASVSIADTVSAANKDRLQATLQALKTEAGLIDNLSTGSPKPRFTRPHPALRSLGADMAIPVLIEMSRRLDSNDYRDTFIKWHLMYVVKKADRADRRAVADRLTRLLKEMPGQIKVGRREPYDDQPEEIAEKYWKLWSESAVRTGYPPFVKTYHGRDAIQYVRADKKAEWTKMADELERLRKLWTRVPNRENIKFNSRVTEVKFIVRQYRGELIYEMLRTNDPKVLRLISDAIERNVKAKQTTAFDLLTYVYAATTDGVLSGFEQTDLEDFGRDIKRVARSSEGYAIFQTSEDFSPYKNRKRDFADYAFHLINMLENLDVNALPGAIPN